MSRRRVLRRGQAVLLDGGSLEALGGQAGAEGEGLGQVDGLDSVGLLEIRDRARDSKGAMESANGEAETLDGRGGDPFHGRLETVEAFEVRRRHVGVSKTGARRETGRGTLASGGHPQADRLRRFLRRR